MSQTVAEFILHRLHAAWGVTRVYGYPGDGINGLLGAFHAHGDDVRFVQLRHEEIAAFAATAHAKFTGEAGRAAAEILNAGSRAAILIGQGAVGAAAEVEEVADLLGCGVAKALNGKAAVPDDRPWVTGGIGLLGTKPSDEMMRGCDTLL